MASDDLEFQRTNKLFHSSINSNDIQVFKSADVIFRSENYEHMHV